MRRWLFLALLVPALGHAAPPDGQQIVLHGNDNGAMPCAACHGAEGGGNAAIGAPELAGRPASAIAAKLAQFASGQGGTPVMQFIARALTPAETQAVATYLAGLPKQGS